MALIKLALDLDGPEINLMLYHKLGLKKYESLGLKYELSDAEPYAEEDIEHFTNQIKSYGLKAKAS